MLVTTKFLAGHATSVVCPHEIAHCDAFSYLCTRQTLTLFGEGSNNDVQARTSHIETLAGSRQTPKETPPLGSWHTEEIWPMWQWSSGKLRYAVTLAFVIRIGKVGCAAPYMPRLVKAAARPSMFSHDERCDQCLYVVCNTFRALLKRDYGVA